MSELYGDEADRVRKVAEVFTKYHIQFDLEDKATYPMDAALSVNNHHYVIVEYKNEAGNTSAEPYFQAIGYYIESTRDAAITHFESALPCILLVIFGWSVYFLKYMANS